MINGVTAKGKSVWNKTLVNLLTDLAESYLYFGLFYA
jgi:hypothetical protein